MAITLTCRNYDGTNAILRGIVKADGLDLEIREAHDVAGMFAGLFKGESDVSEMSLAELIYYTSRDMSAFVGIPVFPSRMFRHGFIFSRSGVGIEKPQDLSGKKIGFLRWVQTAAIWMRGMLVEEYEVSPKDRQWYVASIHHWDDADPDAEVIPYDGTTIRRIESHGKNTSERACKALFDGEIDALGVTETQLPTLLANKRVKRLFENSREVEANYFRKTKVFPIMHVLAVRGGWVQKRPELPQRLFQMFCDAKQWARDWRRSMPSLVEAWPQDHIEEEQRIFDTDPWAYGLEANRHVLAKFLTYCRDQGIAARDLSAEELFAESTWKLHE